MLFPVQRGRGCVASSVRRALALVCIAALQAGSAHLALAQSPPDEPETTAPQRSDPAPGETVRERDRPAYDAVGVRLGGFFLFPEFSATEFYRDNIFYEESGGEGDFVTVLSPGARLASNWSRHAVSVSASVDQGLHANNSDENYLDARFGADGRIDVARDFFLTAGMNANRLHEDRSSPDQTGAAEPVTYWRYGTDLGVVKRFNRLRVEATGRADIYRYDNVDAIGGGVFVSEDRDRREMLGSFEVGYAISDRIEPYVRGAVNQRAYDEDAAGGQVRDSDGWETVLGGRFDLGGITSGEVYAGYLEQTYDSSAFETISGISFGGALTWNPTGLTTVEVALDRTVEETTVSGASGGLRTGGTVSVDHELRRHVIVSADGAYALTDYDSITREDRTGSGELGATYLFNRNLSSRAGYRFQWRRSNVTGADYDVQTFLISLTAKL